VAKWDDRGRGVAYAAANTVAGRGIFIDGKQLKRLFLAALVLIYAYLLASNIMPVNYLAKVAGNNACYRYLGFNNGHFLEDVATGEVSVFYIRPLVRVTSCK